jgi:hypothetical protein
VTSIKKERNQRERKYLSFGTHELEYKTTTTYMKYTTFRSFHIYSSNIYLLKKTKIGRNMKILPAFIRKNLSSNGFLSFHALKVESERKSREQIVCKSGSIARNSGVDPQLVMCNPTGKNRQNNNVSNAHTVDRYITLQKNNIPNPYLFSCLPFRSLCIFYPFDFSILFSFQY